MKALHSFEMSQTTHPTAQCHMSEDPNPVVMCQCTVKMVIGSHFSTIYLKENFDKKQIPLFYGVTGFK
jgi:hypothetical protein